MPNKHFSERLNAELDEIGLPPSSSERIEAFAKMLKLPKFKAEALLNGSMTPDEHTMTLLSNELEVEADWLLGKSEKKSSAH